MYRQTVDSDLELSQILGIYNEITGRNRTIRKSL